MTDDTVKPLLRLAAYYYSFEPTKSETINRVLAAVACAGKAFHHTEDWADESHKIDSYLEGDTPVEWIQSAANEAATQLSTLRAENERMRKAEPIWIVNEIGELGVMVNGVCYFMYKAGNIVYDGMPYDDGEGDVHRQIRTLYKREFGECVQPIDMERLRQTGRCYYKKMDMSEGEWVHMPVPPKWFKASHKRGIEFMPEIRAALSPKEDG